MLAFLQPREYQYQAFTAASRFHIWRFIAEVARVKLFFLLSLLPRQIFS